MKRIAAEIASKAYDIELIGAKKAEALIKKRIFNEGKDADGLKMATKSKNVNVKKSGVYSHPYGQRRKKGIKINGKVYKGRRNNVMDFQLTGSLFQSIQVAEKNGKPVLKITNEKLSDIANYLEKQQDAEIFSLSDNERSDVRADMRTAILKEIQKSKKA